MADFRAAANSARDQLDRFGITPREAEVLRMVVDLYGNADIAARLAVSKRTVESHVSALLRKFSVGDRAALIRAASRLVRNEAPSRTPRSRRDRQPQARTSRDATNAAKTARRRLSAKRQQSAYERAVQREHIAITVHEAAATRHDSLAATWDAQALTASDETTRVRYQRQAATARKRAEAARARAEQTRQRLLAGGVRPGTTSTRAEPT